MKKGIDKPGNSCYTIITKGKEKEIKKMMTCEVEILYDDYRWECEQNGVEPKLMEQWWEELV